MWRNKSPSKQHSDVKTPYILSLNAYISKTNSVTPNFLSWKVMRRLRYSFWQNIFLNTKEQHTETDLSANLLLFLRPVSSDYADCIRDFELDG